MVCVLVTTPHLRLLFTRVLISTPRVLLPTTIHVPTCSFLPTAVPKDSSPSFFYLPCCCTLLLYLATPLLGLASGSYLSGPSNRLTAWSALPASPQKSSTRGLLLRSRRCPQAGVAGLIPSLAPLHPRGALQIHGRRHGDGARRLFRKREGERWWRRVHCWCW